MLSRFRVRLVAIACAATIGTLAGPVLSGARSVRGAQADAPACDETVESDARRILATSAAATGESSVESATALDRLVEVLLRSGKGAQPSTRELAERAVRLKDVPTGPDPVGLSASLDNLGRVLLDAGYYPQALPPLARALALREQSLPATDVRIAETLDDQGYAFSINGRDADARQALDRARRIKEAALGPAHERLAPTLERLVRLLQKQGNYPAARGLIERAVSIREAHQADHLGLAEALNLYGDQLWFEGRIPEARTFYQRAIGFVEQDCADSHPRLSVYLSNLSAAMTRAGDLESAVGASEKALTIAEATLGSDHPDVANALNTLANRRWYQSEFAAARSLYEQALRVVNGRPGADPLRIATYVHNLAILNASLGEFVEARRQEDRAIAIWERTFGPGHPTVARGLYALAEALRDQQRNTAARPLYERVLAIRERTLEPGHRDLAQTQMGLAATLFELGSFARASELSVRALNSLERREGNADLTLARALVIRAKLELASGDEPSARAHFERGVTIREQILGSAHPLVAEARLGLATTAARGGDLSSALEQALEAEAIRRGHIKSTVRYLPERQSLTYAAQGVGGLDLALSLAGAEPGAAPRVLDLLIRGRAVVLDEMAERRHVGADLTRPDVAPLWSALVSARQRYANLVVRGPSEQQPAEYVGVADQARREKEQAETALAAKSAAFRDELLRKEVGLEDVRAALPPGSALVAFARYDRTRVDVTAAAPSPAATPVAGARRSSKPVVSYIAFVMRAGAADVGVVPLGSATSIDALVTRWRGETMGVVRASSTTEAEKSYRVAGTALRQKVWDPIRDHLKGASTVFVVPDGTLNFVSLAALPVGPTKYLIDQGPVIHYLSAERDLAKNASPASATRGLLAVGGAAFDDASSFTKASRRPVSPARAVANGSASAAALRATCGNLQSMQFQPLAGTGREVHDVARLWTGSPSQILENRDATERAFKREAPGHRVLHLATHGFFLDGLCPPAVAGTRSVGGLSTGRTSESKLGLGESPLLLAGLALAGANRRAIAGPADEDGILTAEEVTALNLEGVEWAVLSACDTGLGDVKAGEGVFGLRRAFQIAGVRTVIMSLWSVDDQAARLWMRTLYERRLQKHLNTAEALHEASLSVLRDRRARGLSTHPFYWAGFVATGDWR